MSAGSVSQPLEKPIYSVSLLGYMAIMATLYTLYLCKPIILPIVVSVFFAFFSSPLVAKLEKFKIPRALGALGVMTIAICMLIGIGLIFTGPAQLWWNKIPQAISELSTSLVETEEGLIKEISMTAEDTTEKTADSGVKGAGEELKITTILAIFRALVSATPILVMQILATMFLVYFFLVYGNSLLLRFLQSFPSFKGKRATVEIIQKMQEQLSSYVLTISTINLGLAIAVGLVFWMMGVKEAYLWGALAGILNFAPYIGPLISAGIFFLVAFIQSSSLTFSFLVPSIYMMINIVENQFVTPTLVGNSLKLNPLVVFLWLLIWGWIWGVFGMLVGVPMLVCLIIYLEQSNVVGQWYLLAKR